MNYLNAMEEGKMFGDGNCCGTLFSLRLSNAHHNFSLSAYRGNSDGMFCHCCGTWSKNALHIHHLSFDNKTNFRLTLTHSPFFMVKLVIYLTDERKIVCVCVLKPIESD